MHCRYSFTSMEMRYAVLLIDYFDVLNEFLRGRPLIGHVGKLIAIPVGKVMEGNTSIHFCSIRTRDIFTYMKSIRTVTIIIYNLLTTFFMHNATSSISYIFHYAIKYSFDILKTLTRKPIYNLQRQEKAVKKESAMGSRQWQRESLSKKLHPTNKSIPSFCAIKV